MFYKIYEGLLVFGLLTEWLFTIWGIGLAIVLWGGTDWRYKSIALVDYGKELGLLSTLWN